MAVEHDGTARVRELLAMDKTSIPPNGGGRFNRLIFEASPYLLQHAENPVAWHPWGEEAFAEARRENKPVFLSIGYATCHWCHVMAHESFEDPDVAAVINRHYVPVKVDREERPDIDDQYMLVAQMMTGSGGWPLNIIMTPEREPFFAITYMPKNPRAGMPGIVEIMENIATLWRTRRDLVVNNCAAVMEGLAQQAVVTGVPGSVDAGGLAAASWEQLKRLYDPEWGGFGGAPKFPMPHFISFLLRHGVRMGDKEPLRMAEHTLDMMRRGGICDQIGFGFHRYAVDRHWLVPHFEKMLYDQALIGDVCLDVFRVTSAPRYLEMAEEILAFVAADLTSPDGGFYAALDADSEGEEGKCYLWTPDEVEALLGDGDAALICRLFDVTAGGNFEGRSILHLRRSVEDVAADEGCAAEDLRARLRRWRETLLAARSGRGQPLRDEKVLTAWNGLMIATLARAYGVTGTARHLAAATGAADFILRHLVTSEGRLLRSWHSGRTGTPAFLEDYAFFVHGLIALHQATLDGRFLDEALKFAGEMLRLFSDQGGGGLFDVGNDMVPALVRMKGSTDGVVPSGNAVAAMDLLRLGRISGDDELCRRGEEIVAALSGHAARAPANHLHLLVACDYREGEGIEITLEGDRESPGMTAMLRVLHRTYLPGLTIWHANKEGGGMVRASVCAAGACRPPVMGADALDMLLSDLVQPVGARRRDVARELGR